MDSAALLAYMNSRFAVRETSKMLLKWACVYDDKQRQVDLKIVPEAYTSPQAVQPMIG